MQEFKPGFIQARVKESRTHNVLQGEEEAREIARPDGLSVQQLLLRDQVDQKMGFSSFIEGAPKLGWLLNISETIVDDNSCADGRAGIDLYFFQDDGQSFKCTIIYDPYFYLVCTSGAEVDVQEYLLRKFTKKIISIEIVEMHDLSITNHLVGVKITVLKIRFFNMDYFKQVKQFLAPIATRNSSKGASDQMFESLYNDSKTLTKKSSEPMDHVIELREYDLIYYTRVTIDKDLRVGLWYNVRPIQGQIIIEPRPDIVRRADPVVFAFDIETTKLPLRFPDSSLDSIMMISYMIDGQGFLITNRDVVGSDIADFEFTPKPEYSGSFVVFNEFNEKALLRRFFDHIILARPTVFVTYNGDYFDWPFIDARATINGYDLMTEIGFSKNSSGEYLSSYGMHMDAFYWVKRDSYLPQGSQNLKAVASYKLGYNPIELDPECMTRFAAEQPQVLAEYSVSDAVATYYLYMKYVHPFTFSLCNIIPMHPDDVLRRGSGTLCEHLLMVQSFKANVLMPNKHVEKGGKFYDGHMLNSETYVGGHVEALEAGVFRSDLPTKFKLSSKAFQQLIDEIDSALRFSIVEESKFVLEDITNYKEIRDKIVDALVSLRDVPNRNETPSIYHLDVAAMYPNIILTNRLQPDSIVNDEICTSCDFNTGPDSSCQRRMPWSWRGEYFLSSRGEYNMIKNQLEQGKYPSKKSEELELAFHQLSLADQDELIKKRMTEYTRKVYGKTFVTKVIEKESIVCQRENPIYVNTVRDFRDRRYEYKKLLKHWKRKLDTASEAGDTSGIDEASRMVVIFDSLQTAHKCILNSFYGYVMRKGSRWYSMEMAGIVCLTGAKIIQLARARVELVGRPLELDTDGIWCLLPASFPDIFSFNLKDGNTFTISYPCVMLNHLVHDQFTNEQYQELVDPKTLEYCTRSENSIFFEVDGPYRAMILPASTEEDKLLKKRYAVFNHDGTLAELKGFEVKRRGELKLIKNFQSSIFKVFLEGSTLDECYSAVANESNSWIDILESKGVELTDSELFDLVSENRSMSKALEAYGAQKSTSITTAKRLADLLGEQMVQTKGLNCKFIVTEKPLGAPVSERAVPVALFQSEPSVQKHFLRKWLKDNSIQTPDIRQLIDWAYYLERFGSVIQKLITIPAASQNITNPIPRIKHPDWLLKRLLIQDNRFKQTKISNLLVAPLNTNDENREPTDLEETNIRDNATKYVPIARLFSGKRHAQTPLEKLRTKKSKFRRHAVEKSDNPYSPFNEYKKWMLAEQTSWVKKIKDYNNSRRLLDNISQNNATSYFQSNALAFMNQNWELIHLAETDSHGIFRLWAIINDRLESIDIDVPRIIFLNSRVVDPNETVCRPGLSRIKRSRTLPRGHPCLNLYELQMTEFFYRNHANVFSSMFNHKDIEGVYETNVPLLFRALIQLGTFASLNIPASEYDNSIPLSLDGIGQAKRGQAKKGHWQYLAPESLQILYVFHARANSRQVIGVFSPALGTLLFCVVDSGKNSGAIPSIKKLYSDLKALDVRDVKDQLYFQYPDSLKVETSIDKNEKDCYARINDNLLKHKSISGKPCLLMLQSSNTLKYYRNSGLSALRDFPIMIVPTHKSDNDFPALAWQSYGANRMLGNVFNLNNFLIERIQLARYANVPVCNIENDFTLFLSDLFLARRLKKADAVLWCSLSPKPDLGGCEQDNNKFKHQEFKSPEVDNPGSYDNVSIQLDLWDLSLNTLIRPSLFGEDLDSSAASTTNGNIYTIDASSLKSKVVSRQNYSSIESPQHALTAIKGLIKDWMRELKDGNIFASNLLEHLHRWISSSFALLHDPMIVSHTQNLMKRSFAALLEEFRRLGSKVIYATFDKIVISTTKATLDGSMGYIKYVLAAISKNTNFEHIELKPSGFWDHLIWYDSYNYGGLCFPVNDQDDGDVTEEIDSIIDMRWNIAEYLPPVVQNIFMKCVAEYLYVIKTFKKESSNYRAELLGYLEKDLRRKLFVHVENIQNRRPTDAFANKGYIFPRLPGSSKLLTNPALEFIKMMTYIFQLDSKLDEQVRLLKKDLLTLIDFKEFSNQAIFENPCEKYLLGQVICEYCNYCCDLDLTRKLTEGSFIQCAGCCMTYDQENIELMLIVVIQSMLTEWQLQDLRCISCRMIRAEELAEHCARCTGILETVNKYSAFMKPIEIIKNIAEYYKMENLLELSSSVLLINQ